MLSAILLTQFAVIVTPVYSTPIQAQNADPSAAQGIVSFYKDVFEYDWAMGIQYDPDRDGMGLAQNFSLGGSGFRDFSRPPQTIEGEMSITPVLSPDNSIPQTIALIESAQETLEIQTMYITDSFVQNIPTILEAIIDALDRGVEVRIIVSHHGSNQDPLDQLTAAGATIRISRSNASAGNYFDTMHNKGIIVDGVKVLISSINWSANSLQNNREAAIIVENEEVGAYYLDIFDYDWGASEEYDKTSHFTSASHETPIPASEGDFVLGDPSAAYSYAGNFPASTFSGEMKVTCIVSPDNCFDVVRDLLENAQTSIDVSVYTLSHPFLMQTLIDRMEAGVQVRLLLDSNTVSGWERNYNRWTMANLTASDLHDNPAAGNWANTANSAFEGADPAFRFQHSKYCIIDDATLIISSGNWASTSCPTPRNYDGEGHANVRGNRDWWFVVYGDGSYVPGQYGFDLFDLLEEISFGFSFLLFAAVGIAFLVFKKSKIINQN